MIDNKDSTESMLRLILWDALSTYSTKNLINLTHDKSVIVRTSAAKQLQRRASIDVFEHSISLCHSKIKNDREIGAFILGQLGSPELPYKQGSLPILVALLYDRSKDVRIAALTSIGHLGSGIGLTSDLIGAIEPFSNDKSSVIRLACAFALGAFSKESRAPKILKEMLQDSDDSVAEWAEVSLEIINER